MKEPGVNSSTTNLPLVWLLFIGSGVLLFHTHVVYSPSRHIRYLLAPFLGAYIADTYWGRFKTVGLGLFVTLVGHVLFMISAVLVTVDKEGAIGAFVVALFIKRLGNCVIDTNIVPLLAEQYERTKLFVIVTNRGERVIVDPALTVSRIYMVSRMCVTYVPVCGPKLINP